MRFRAGNTSRYAQMMGLLLADLVDAYYFTSYNNKTLYAQIRFGVP